MIRKALRFPLYDMSKMPKHAIIIGKESFEINNGSVVEISITWPFIVFPNGKHVDSGPVENALAAMDFDSFKSYISKNENSSFPISLSNGERKLLKRGVDFTLSPEEPFTN